MTTPLSIRFSPSLLARLRTQSLVDSFESRDAWLRSGMETGVDEGYAKLDRMLADDTI